MGASKGLLMSWKDVAVRKLSGNIKTLKHECSSIITFKSENKVALSVVLVKGSSQFFLSVLSWNCGIETTCACLTFLWLNSPLWPDYFVLWRIILSVYKFMKLLNSFITARFPAMLTSSPSSPLIKFPFSFLLS